MEDLKIRSFWKVYRPSLKRKSSGRALFVVLFKKLLRQAKTFKAKKFKEVYD